jgi:hypothetical protein
MMYRTDLRASSGWRHFDRMGLKLGRADMELGSLMQHNAEEACRADRLHPTPALVRRSLPLHRYRGVAH